MPIDKDELFALYEKIDDYGCRLKTLDAFWGRCFPCNNNGACCKNSHTYICESEKLIIKDFLDELPDRTLTQIEKKVIEAKNCALRFKDCCIIHEVRPYICRLVPYTCYLSNEKITYHLLDDMSCNSCDCEQNFLNEKSKYKYYNSLFADLAIDFLGSTRKYLNGDFLKKDTVVNKIINEAPSSISDFLREYFLTR